MHDERLPPPRLTAVLSLEGRALSGGDSSQGSSGALRATHRVAQAVLALVREGYSVAVVHGAEVQLDHELLRMEEASTKLPPAPLDLCIAAAQGALSCQLALGVRNVLKRSGVKKQVSGTMMHVLVSLDDGTSTPTPRAVGPSYPAWRARELMRRERWRMIEEPGQGWRRLVPSPRPLDIVGFEAIDALLDAGHVVITGGGGGVPVYVDKRGALTGAIALVHQDRSAALLAEHLGADLLVMLSERDHLFVDYGRPSQRRLERVGRHELETLHAAGQFPEESTGPSVEAALEFVCEDGTSAIITSASKLAAALADRAGTRVTRQDTESGVRRQLPLFESTAPTGPTVPADEESNSP